MFDIDSGKLLILGVIALIVIKPKDLPGVMRQVGATLAQLRRMAAEFQGQFKDAMREAELDDLKKEMAKVTDFDGLDPFTDLHKSLNETRAEIETSFEGPKSPSGEHTFAESIEPAPAPRETSPAIVDSPPHPAPSQLLSDTGPAAEKIAVPARDGGAS